MTAHNTIGIYLLSSERCGTNLLRQRLTDRSPTVCSINPIHILRTLGYWEFNMGPLSNDENWNNVISYALRCCYERAIPWDEKFDVNYVKDEYTKRYQNQRTIIRLNDMLYQLYAEAKGCSHYFCKDLWLADFTDAIAAQLPHARFIHLYRDPRDYIASQKRRPFGEQSAIKLANIWLHECNASRKAINNLEDDAIKFSLSYEEFIQNEDVYLNEILQRFNLDAAIYNKQKDGINSKAEFKKWKQFHEWKNVHRETMKSNFNKYRKLLSKTDITITESICWNTMIQLGYRTEYSQRPELTIYQKSVYPLLMSIKKYFRIKINDIRHRHSAINRKATNELVIELTKKYR